MNRERLVSVVGGRAKQYVALKKPSKIIPFKGDFPLLQPYQIEDYNKAIESTENLEDLSDEFQKVTEKGNRIALLEEGFRQYLLSYGITEEDFLKFNNSEKSDRLIDWMNKDCINFSQLTIK